MPLLLAVCSAVSARESTSSSEIGLVMLLFLLLLLLACFVFLVLDLFFFGMVRCLMAME